MDLRKEQVLLGLTALLGLWIGSGYFGDPSAASRWSPQTREFEAQPVGVSGLIETAAEPLMRRDFFTEPSETRPLPPRALAFPPGAPLSVCGLPLDPGPDYRHSYMLGRDGSQVADVTLQQGPVADGGGGNDVVDQEPNAVGPMSAEQAAKIYDRVYAGGLSAPFFGRLEAPPGVDLFALEESGQFDGIMLRLRRFSLKDNKLLGPISFGGDGQPIDRIVLADTLRNEVQRQVRKVPDGLPAPGQRQKLISWLLAEARNEAWVYDEALTQAEAYLQLSGGTLDGLAVMRQVLRARGDLAGELQLLEGLPDEGLEAAFKAEGLGVLKARLGLWAEAEAMLRKAVRLAPNDARSHGALADFLRRRGRTFEAAAAAERARRTLGSVQDERERARIVRTILSCDLAVGDVDNARDLVGSLPADLGQTYLRGCINYASGDTAAALLAFKQTGAGPDAGRALLGQAACLLANGEWQQAYDLFVRVADQDPLLRHRAMTGLALLSSRIGQFEAALGYIDRALEAFPDDPYALYLRGRTLRLMGQPSAAQEALADALRQRDDFVHAIAEMSAVQTDLAVGASAEDQVLALVAARKYADRAVELSPRPELELLELAGLRAFAAADARAATAAFEQARDLAADDQHKAYAKAALAVVDYSRGRVEDATTSLERLERDLDRDSLLGKWAGATVLAIDDHANKEMLGDGFDRGDVGSLWTGDSDGRLRADIRDGRLVFDGTFTNSSEVAVARVGAVLKAKNFLACSVDVALGPAHAVADSFVGLGIEIQSGTAGVDVSARIGLSDGRPFLTLQDGREDGRDNQQRVALSEDLMAAGKPQRVELRVVPIGDEGATKLQLQCSFNDVLVHAHDLKQLTNTELKTILFASGNKRSRVDVAFDDYRLERKKDR